MVLHKAMDNISDREWHETLAFYQHCHHVSLIKHGTILKPNANPRHYLGVTEEDWMAVKLYDLMADFVKIAGAERIEAVTGPYRTFLHLTATTAIADDARFEAEMAQAPAGMAEQLRPLRTAWANARLAPVPRAQPGETTKTLLARLNRGMGVSAAYALGLEQLRSGRFVDNATQHVLLPYTVPRRRALAADVPCRWHAAPGFEELTPAERAAVDLMLRTLCIGEDYFDLMDEYNEGKPNGDAVLERIYGFQSAAADMALQDSVTADLPTGAPGSFLDSLHNPFDMGLYLLDAAMIFHSRQHD